MSSHGVAIYVSFRNIRKDSIEREVYRWAEPYSRPSIPLFVDTEGSTSLNACRETVGRPFRRDRRPASSDWLGVMPPGRERRAGFAQRMIAACQNVGGDPGLTTMHRRAMCTAGDPLVRPTVRA